LYNGAWLITTAAQYSLNIFTQPVGGIRGAYYSDYGMQFFYFARTDWTVNFTWGYDTVFKTAPVGAALTNPYPVDYFSVVWTGVVTPPTSEIYRMYFVLSQNTGAQLFLNGQLVLDAWILQAGPAIPFADVSLVQNQQYNLRIQFRAATGNASIVWMWSTLTIPQQVVPSRFLSMVQPVAWSPYLITIVPNVIVANTSYIQSSPMPQFYGATPVTFTIQMCDAYGNNQLTSTTAIASLITVGLTGSPAVTGYVQPYALGNGLYNVTLTPTTSGVQVISIYYNGVLIKGLPVTLNVLPGVTLPTFSTVVTTVSLATTTSTTTPWLVTSLYNSTAGFYTTFTIQARDGASNPRLVGGDLFTVNLTGVAGSPAAGTTIAAVVRDNLDGTYNVSYTPYVAGTYTLNIYQWMVSAQVQACSSPWTVTILCAIPTRPSPGPSTTTTVGCRGRPPWCALIRS